MAEQHEVVRRSDLIPGDQFVIEDAETIKVIADPLRLRLMLETIDAPRTVKELAATLDVPQTRLYYHMKLLEKHGLISVAGRRMVSGIEERSYRSPANGWTISKDLMADAVFSGLLAALFDLTRAELEMALANSNAEPGNAESDVPLLTFTRLWLSEDEVIEVQRGFQQVLERFATSEPGPGKSEYNGAFTLYRTKLRPTEEPSVDAP